MVGAVPKPINQKSLVKLIQKYIVMSAWSVIIFISIMNIWFDYNMMNLYEWWVK